MKRNNLYLLGNILLPKKRWRDKWAIRPLSNREWKYKSKIVVIIGLKSRVATISFYPREWHLIGNPNSQTEILGFRLN